MKRIVSIVLALAMVLAFSVCLTGCGGKKVTEVKFDDSLTVPLDNTYEELDLPTYAEEMNVTNSYYCKEDGVYVDIGKLSKAYTTNEAAKVYSKKYDMEGKIFDATLELKDGSKVAYSYFYGNTVYEEKTYYSTAMFFTTEEGTYFMIFYYETEEIQLGDTSYYLNIPSKYSKADLDKIDISDEDRDSLTASFAYEDDWYLADIYLWVEDAGDNTPITTAQNNVKYYACLYSDNPIINNIKAALNTGEIKNTDGNTSDTTDYILQDGDKIIQVVFVSNNEDEEASINNMIQTLHTK